MQINGIDISRWHARQWSVSIGNHSITNESEWNRGSPDPFMVGSKVGFKTIKVTLLLKNESREVMTADRSDLVATLMKPADIALDGFSHKFRVVLTKDSSIEETVGHRQDLWHKLTLELQGYEYGSEIAVAGTGTLKIMNPGNMDTPAILELIPSISTIPVNIRGISRNQVSEKEDLITVKNLITDKKVIIDGETGLITQDGKQKAGDVDLWELPVLIPGINTVTCDNVNVKMNIKFKPRYM